MGCFLHHRKCFWRLFTRVCPCPWNVAVTVCVRVCLGPSQMILLLTKTTQFEIDHSAGWQPSDTHGFRSEVYSVAVVFSKPLRLAFRWEWSYGLWVRHLCCSLLRPSCREPGIQVSKICPRCSQACLPLGQRCVPGSFIGIQRLTGLGQGTDPGNLIENLKNKKQQ